MTKIKLCGLSRPCDIEAVNELKPDYIGFVFAKKSKRYVTPEKAMELKKMLDPSIEAAGVFVNEDVNTVAELLNSGVIDIAQLHGDEDLAYVTALHKILVEQKVRTPRIVRAISVSSRSSVLKAMMWDGYVDGILFETPTNGYGGSGESFDWSLLSSYRGRTPFFLTGGIGPNSLEALKEFEHPMWLGVDLNSRFESEPGVKDVELLKPFITELREAILKGDNKVYTL